MGRSAVLEGVEQETELLPGLLRSDIQKLEDPALNILAVYSDTPTADLGAIEDQVVGPGADLAWI